MDGLKDILNKMTSADPSARPTMEKAHQLLRAHRQSLSEEALTAKVKYDDGFPRGPDGELIKRDNVVKKPTVNNNSE